MGHISEVFLSDDEELPPFSYKVIIVIHDNHS